MTGFHVATLALSAYNVIARSGPKSPQEITAALKLVWMQSTEQDEVDDGIKYLSERGFIDWYDGKIFARYVHNNAAATVVRNPNDLTDLVIVNGTRC